jgi:hypothetical protein
MTGPAQKVVRLRTDNTRKDEQRLYHLAKQRWHYQMVRLAMTIFECCVLLPNVNAPPWQS